MKIAKIDRKAGAAIEVALDDGFVINTWPLSLADSDLPDTLRALADKIEKRPGRYTPLAVAAAPIEISRAGAKITIPSTSPLFDKVLEMVAVPAKP